MSRSIWKGPYVNNSIFKRLKNKKIKIWSRDSTIPYFLLGETVLVHNGQEFKKVVVTREKIGYKFGEFSYTRKHVSKIKPNISINKKTIKK